MALLHKGNRLASLMARRCTGVFMARRTTLFTAADGGALMMLQRARSSHAIRQAHVSRNFVKTTGVCNGFSSGSSFGNLNVWYSIWKEPINAAYRISFIIGSVSGVSCTVYYGIKYHVDDCVEEKLKEERKSYDLRLKEERRKTQGGEKVL
uniref:Uncharacterized protein n=1 Tax=Oryza glumipatula TaxID=40148 RepID=A0A0D9ZFK3_9ORYZ